MDISEPHADAVAYLESLSLPGGAAWADRVRFALRTHAGGPETFALLHPMYFDEDPRLAARFQLQRRFREGAIEPLRVFGCQAIRVWGYRCVLDVAGELVADHRFPYGLGGSTESSNLLPLCRYHNQVKTSDIHTYNGWHEPPPWVWAGLGRRLAHCGAIGW